MGRQQTIAFKGFVDGAYTLDSVKVDAQECINYYPEQNEIVFGKETGQLSILPPPGFTLIPTPGSQWFFQVDNGPVRGMWTLPDGRFIVVSANNCYVISYTGVFNLLLVGSLQTNSGPVSISDNGVQVIIVDGLYGYIITIGTPTGKPIFNQILDPTFQANGASFVVFNDGYFIVGSPNSAQWYLSNLYDGTVWNPLDFATKEGTTDWLMCPKCCNGYVWLVGNKSIEIYYDSGNANFPFSRIAGVQVQYGTWSGGSVQVLDNSLIWVGTAVDGGCSVWKMNGYTPARVSNFAVELDLGNASGAQLAGMTSWIYQRNGHSFYNLNIPGFDHTWTLDLATGKWHKRTTLDKQGQRQQHQFLCSCAAYGFIFGGDQYGSCYTLKENLCTDGVSGTNGVGSVPIERVRISPHIGRMMMNVIHNRVELDFQAGAGTNTGQGSNPQMMMQYSDDGGSTWSTERWQSMGRIGQTFQRLRWDQCGMARNRVYKFRLTDPVWVPIVGAQIGITVGTA